MQPNRSDSINQVGFGKDRAPQPWLVYCFSIVVANCMK